MVCMHPDLLARVCKLVKRKKLGLICFPRICFPRLIYCDQEPLLLLNVTEALKLTDLWNTKLLFDLSYKFINGSFAFSCG